MTRGEFEVAVPGDEVQLGEGPAWDAASGTLLWVDILAGAVHRYDPDAGVDVTIPVGDLVTLAVPRRDGGVVIGLPDGLHVLDGASGASAPLAAVEADRPENRSNDGACDPQGRLWFGTMARDEESPTAGLYRIDAPATVTRVLGDTTISNGLGWSPAGDRFYFIDSPTRRIDVFDFDGATGAVANRRTLVNVDAGEGAVPDGMSVDAEGCLWVALHGGWGLRRYSPEGELLAVVELPVARVTSCCFAGPELRDVYVTTRREGLGDAELAAQPLAGSLLRLDPGVAGQPSYAFAG